MMAKFADYIQQINPKEGYYIEYFDTQYPDIIDRARSILDKRTIEEIYEGAKIVDAVLSGDDTWSNLDHLAELLENNEAMPPSSPAQELGYYLSIRRSNGDLLNTGYDDEELLAILTLALVAEAYDEQKQLKKIADNRFDAVYWSQLGAWAIEAMEAVVLAECLLLKKMMKEAEKNRRKKIGVAGGKKGHEATTRLLTKLVNFYKEKNYESYSKAVSEFLEAVPEEEYRHLAPTNRERTLRDALSAIMRGKRTLHL